MAVGSMPAAVRTAAFRRRTGPRALLLAGGLAAALLGLSGCAVGDGIAHVVKLTQRQNSDSPAPAAATPATPDQPTTAVDDATPAPAPAPAPRDSIKVEELKPPS